MKIISNAVSHVQTIQTDGNTFVRITTERNYTTDEFEGGEGKWTNWFDKEHGLKVDPPLSDHLEEVYQETFDNPEQIGVEQS